MQSKTNCGSNREGCSIQALFFVMYRDAVRKLILLLCKRKEVTGIAREFSKEFYNSKVWKEVREAVLKRDCYLCQTPGCYQAAEEVHHKKLLTPENMKDPRITVNMDNLISLCSKCHKEIHHCDKVAGLKARGRQQDILPEIEFDENGYSLPVRQAPRGSG